MCKRIILEETLVMDYKFKFKSTNRYIVDMSAVDFVDSITLSQILRNRDSVVLVNVQPRVLEIIKILNCIDKLRIVETIEEAEELLK